MTHRAHRVTAPAIVMALAAALITAPPAHAVDYPTWDDVVAARSDEAATAATITELTGLLASLQQQAESATTVAEQRGAELQQAQDAQDAADERLRSLTEQVDAAQLEAVTAERQVAQWAASSARTGGRDLTASIAFSGAGGAGGAGGGGGAGGAGGADASPATGPDDLLSRLGTAAQLAETADRMLADATTTANTARALGDQAQVATDERDRLADTAASALADAQEAQLAAQTAVTEQEERRIELDAQLAVLQQRTATAEQGFAAAEAARAKAAAEAAARAAAARAASAAAGGSGGSSSAPSSSAVSGSGWTMPITSYSGYQAYGMRIHPVYGYPKLHAGADFSASCGTSLFAASSGTVTYAGPYGGFGNLITIAAPNGVSTNYGHMYAGGVQVRTGQSVTAGQKIGEVGSAGVSTGCHLHFEARQGGTAVDPVAYLRTQGV